MDVKTILIMFLGLIIFGWILYFCSKCFKIICPEFANEKVKNSRESEVSVNPPSYEEVVSEDKKNLPTFEQIQHM